MSSGLEELFSVRDQVAMITGAGRGIGKETALLLAKAGAKIAILDRDEKAAEDAASAGRADKGQAIAFIADVTNTRRLCAV